MQPRFHLKDVDEFLGARLIGPLGPSLLLFLPYILGLQALLATVCGRCLGYGVLRGYKYGKSFHIQIALSDRDERASLVS